MKIFNTSYSEFLKRSLDMHTSQNQAISENIENANTINYIRKDTDFSELWSHLWGHFGGMNYRNENQSAEEKFKQIARGIKLSDGEEYSLDSIIQNSETKWDSPEWGFPKGRRNHQETDIACAIREWEEETGFRRESLKIIKNLSEDIYH